MEFEPITHLEKSIAGTVAPVTHLEKVIEQYGGGGGGGGGAETVVEVSGTTPTIEPQANTIYQCGELTSLTISNPPATGAWSVVFTSGSTATTSKFRTVRTVLTTYRPLNQETASQPGCRTTTTAAPRWRRLNCTPP